MAVATTLTLRDNVSRTLNRVANSIEKVERLTSRVEDNFSKVEEVTTKAAKSVDSLDKQQKKAVGSAQKLKGIWATIAGTISAALTYLATDKLFDLVQGGRKLAAAKLNADIMLATSLANAGNNYSDYRGVKNVVSGVAANTTLSESALTRAAAEFATYLSDPEAVSSLLPAFANYALGMSGGEAIDDRMAENYATQLGKVFVGAFDGISRKGFKLSDAQKEILKIGTDLEKVAVISEVINESWGGLAVALANTSQGKAKQLANAFDGIYAKFANRFEPALMKFYDTIAANLDKIGPTFEKLGDNIAFAIDKAADFLGWLFKVYEAIGGFDTVFPILLGIGAALAALAVAAGIAAVAMIGVSLPVLAIAGIIGVVTFAIFYGIQALGGWQMAWLKFENAILTIIDNLLLAFGTFVRTVAILANEVIVSIGEVQDALPDSVKSRLGLDIDTQAARDRLAKFAKMQEEHEQGVSRRTAEREQAEKDLAEKLANLEKNRENPLKEFMDKFTGGGGPGIDEIGKVGEVGKINSDINIAKEDLVLLRNIAEARFIQNLVTLTPTMNVENINNNADGEEIMGYFTNNLRQQFDSSIQGA